MAWRIDAADALVGVVAVKHVKLMSSIKPNMKRRIVSTSSGVLYISGTSVTHFGRVCEVAGVGTRF